MPLLPEVDPEQPYVLPPQEGATTGALAERIHRNKKLNAFGYDVVADFGATGVGTAVLLSSRYGSLVAAQVDYPLAQSLDDSLDTVAIEQAINVAAARDSGYPPNNTARETAFGTRLLFSGARDYVITRPIEVPITKSLAFESPVAMGSRLIYDGAGDFMFTFPAGDSSGMGRTLDVKGLVFIGGGFEFEPVIRRVTFDRCLFMYTTGPAIHFTDGPNGGVGFDIVRCEFLYCAGGVWDEAPTFNLARIRFCRFDLMRHVPVLIDTTGVDVEGCDFFGVDAAHPEYPFIWLRGFLYSTAHIRIRNSNRFGSEDSTQPDGFEYGVPESAIVFGELTIGTPDPEDTDRLVTNVTISDNDFMGADTSPLTDDAGLHAIRLNCPARFVSVSGRNQFKLYRGSLVEEAWWAGYDEEEPESGETAIGSINTWEWQNAVHQSNNFPIFSDGGRAWAQQYEDVPFVPVTDPNRPAGNLLTRTDALSTGGVGGWALTGLDATQDADDPDGNPNEAWTLARNTTGSCFIRQNNAVVAGERYVGSVWMRADTETIAYINLIPSGGVGLVSTASRIVLTDRWQRFTVPSQAPVSEPVTTGPDPDPDPPTISFRIYVGPKSSLAHPNLDDEGSIQVWRPMLQAGKVPGAYTSNNDTTPRDRQRNGLILGDAIIGYGTAAPASGYHQVGDVVLNTVPASGQPMGWACSVAGSPGTWVAMPNYA